MKHYDLRVVHLLDPNRKLERSCGGHGWPLLVLVDGTGQIRYKTNNLVEKIQGEITPILESMLPQTAAAKPIVRNGVPYMSVTLKRSGEVDEPKARDRFPAIACGPDGRVYLAFTRDEGANSDVYLRVYDGTKWSEDCPVAATEFDEYDPSLAVNRQGRLWIAWASNAEKSHYNIYVANLKESAEPIRATRVTDADDDAMRGRLAVQDDGTVWLAYYRWLRMGLSNRSRDKEIYVRRWTGTAWSDEMHVSPEDVPRYEDHSDPAIATRGNKVVVAWNWDFHRVKGYTTNAAGPTIFFREVNTEGPQGRTTDLSCRDIDVTPALAIDGAGQIVCAWDSLGYDRESRLERKNLMTRIYDLATREVSPYAKKMRSGLVNVCTPNFATDPKGDLSLIWSETANGTDWSVCRMNFEARTEDWSKVGTVESEVRPRFPAAAYDSKGRLWVAYSVERDGERRIEARALEK